MAPPTSTSSSAAARDRRLVPISNIAKSASSNISIRRPSGVIDRRTLSRSFARSPSRDMRWPSSLAARSDEHTSELQSLMRNSYAVFCLTKNNNNEENTDWQELQHHVQKTKT